MDQLYVSIQELESKLLHLQKTYEQQKAIIHKLQQENDQFRNALLLQKQDPTLEYEKQGINTILQQLKHSKDKDIKKTIGRYIQYLDQYITLLETPN